MNFYNHYLWHILIFPLDSEKYDPPLLWKNNLSILTHCPPSNHPTLSCFPLTFFRGPFFNGSLLLKAFLQAQSLESCFSLPHSFLQWESNQESLVFSLCQTIFHLLPFSQIEHHHNWTTITFPSNPVWPHNWLAPLINDSGPVWCFLVKRPVSKTALLVSVTLDTSGHTPIFSDYQYGGGSCRHSYISSTQF